MTRKCFPINVTAFPKWRQGVSQNIPFGEFSWQFNAVYVGCHYLLHDQRMESRGGYPWHGRCKGVSLHWFWWVSVVKQVCAVTCAGDRTGDNKNP